MEKLGCDASGLTGDEANARLQKYGYNEVNPKKESLLSKIAMKFWGPIPWMLELAAIATFYFGNYRDMYIILFLLLFNSVISLAQESRAQNAVSLLKSKLSVQARVLRDGKWQIVKASLLVPGDVIHLRGGDVVPADLKQMNGEIDVDQSSLTGESLPVTKSDGHMVFSGTTVRRGESTCLVVSTGASTLFGKTTELVASAKSESHIEKLILGIVRYLVAIDGALVIILFLYALYTGYPLSQVVPFSLVVLITSIPVALPATFTIAMAIGAEEMSRKGALVTRLTAIEDASSLDILCLDKTGTITENRISAEKPIVYGLDASTVLEYAALASDESSQDPIDNAVIDFAKTNGIIVDKNRRLNFVPFDSHTKMTQALITDGSTQIKVSKGSPPVMMMSFAYPERMKADIENLSKSGYRIIAVGVEKEKRKIVGILPLHDPPRSDSSSLMKELKNLYVIPKMITGDSSEIASEVASEVGIGSKACVLGEMKNSFGSLAECDIFSQVYPEDKYYIVRELQKSGHVVGMTGDGVNDAAALKQAEVGIAVSNATDIAKASASIVLTHEGLSDIVESVKTGRRIYQRMLTYILNKIVKTIQVVFFLTISFFIFRFFATTPFDIILLIFANDFITMSIATDNARFSSRPEKWRTRPIIITAAIIGAALVIEGIFALYIALFYGLDRLAVYTFIFDILVFSGQFTVYMVRERDHFWTSRPGKWLLTSSFFDILIVSLISWRGILVSPIPASFVLLALIITFAWMAALDQVKNVVFRKYHL
jgi:H+-transporting ATPase